MSRFTELAQQAYELYHRRVPMGEPWALQDAMDATLPFLEEHDGDVDAMPGLRAAFHAATDAEWEAMWTIRRDLSAMLHQIEQETRAPAG